MKYRVMTLALTLMLIMVGAAPALADVDTQAALDYLTTQQNADGGYGSGFSPESTVGSTADAVHAIVAAGGDLATFDQDGNTPLTYLADHAAAVDNAGDLAKMVMAVVAAGENPRTLGGVDSVARLEGMANGDGLFITQNDTFFSHILAVLALASVERPLPDGAADDRHRRRHQYHSLCRAGPGRCRRARGRQGGERRPGLLSLYPEYRRRLALPEPLQLWHRHRRQLDGPHHPGPHRRR